MDRSKEEFLKSFGNHLRNFRKNKGLSGVELARRCNLEKQNLHRIEKGSVAPSIWQIAKICNGLEIEMMDLFRDFNSR